METKYTFVIFVNGREWGVVCDQYIKTHKELRATKFGIWAGAAKFKKTASVYVYKYRPTEGDWEICDSMNARNTDDVTTYLSDAFVRLLATEQIGHRVKS